MRTAELAGSLEVHPLATLRALRQTVRAGHAYALMPGEAAGRLGRYVNYVELFTLIPELDGRCMVHARVESHDLDAWCLLELWHDGEHGHAQALAVFAPPDPADVDAAHARLEARYAAIRAMATQEP